MDLMRSLPLGLYLEKPVTWLHRLDARVKLAWLLAFLLVPILAHAAWRVGLVVGLILLTLTAGIPLRVWRQQMGWLLTVAAFVTLLTAIAPDGYALSYQPRLASPEFGDPADLAPEREGWNWFQREAPREPAAPTLPQPTEYSYVLVKRGPLQISRRSLGLGVRLGTLIFILIYSTNLYLLVTAPEEIAVGLETWMAPLRRWGVPVTEIVLTLTMSLRFIPLVLEEVQNLVRAVRVRAIDWRKIGLRGAIQIWLTLAERLLDNLLMRAEQIAKAMKVRGFAGADKHRVEFYILKLRRRDWFAMGALVAFVGARVVWGWQP